MLTASMDIETLSTKGNAVVLSIGICFFDDEKMQTFEEIVATGTEIFFDTSKQVEMGRDTSPSTLRWWEEQGDEARRVLHAEDTISPRDFYKVYSEHLRGQGLHENWITKHGRWFTRGPHFDIAIMDSLFDDHNVSPPWKFYQVRDIRTWLECHGLPDNLKLVKPEGMVAHNALHDAAFDAWMLQQVKHKHLDELSVDEHWRK
jgi:hypothetical protein